jgi:hypothetical protein
VRRLGLILVALVGSLLAAPTAAAAPGKADDGDVVAYVDGRRIQVEDIPRYYCDDFSYPVIQCSSVPLVADSRALSASLLAGVDYVTIYDQASFQGTWMHVSQDYAALVTVGWNDRVSSFKGRNSETGRFWTDWFNTGSPWSFCCNANVSTLGSYNNTFSSVVRT